MPVEPIPITEFISGTASEHVCRLVPVTSPQTTAGELRRIMAGVHFESATHIGVCDNESSSGCSESRIFSAVGSCVLDSVVGVESDKKLEY